VAVVDEYAAARGACSVVISRRSKPSGANSRWQTKRASPDIARPPRRRDSPASFVPALDPRLVTFFTAPQRGNAWKPSARNQGAQEPQGSTPISRRASFRAETIAYADCAVYGGEQGDRMPAACEWRGRSMSSGRRR